MNSPTLVGNRWKWLEKKKLVQPFPTGLDAGSLVNTGKLDGWTGWTAFVVTDPDMQRTQELFPDPSATTPEAETPAAVASEPKQEPPAPVLPPRFSSIHTLLMRVDTLADVGSGTVFIRDANGLQQQTRTDKIPSDRMAEFVEKIATGQVSVIWGHRYNEFDELDPNWPQHTTVRKLKAVHRTLRATRGGGPRRNDADTD